MNIILDLSYFKRLLLVISLVMLSFGTQNTVLAQNNTFDQKKKIKKAVPNNFKPAIKKGVKLNTQKTGLQQKNIAFPTLRPLQLHSTDAQKNIQQLRKLDAKVALHFSENNGTPIFITGKQLHKANVPSNGKINHKAAAFDFMKANKALLKLEQPEEEFKVRSLETDELGGTHIRLDQQYKNLKIWASDVNIHLNDKGVETFNGRYHPTPEIENVSPTISAEKAIQIVENHLNGFTEVVELSDAEKKWLNHQERVSELMLLPPTEKNSDFRLVWQITFFTDMAHRWEYFVDAHTGEILQHYQNSCFNGPATASATDLHGRTQVINTYEVGGRYYCIDASRPMFNAAQSNIPEDAVGAIATIDFNNTRPGPFSDVSHVTSNNNSWNDPTAVSAHNNAAICYEYYRNKFNRNSLDGKGGNIISFIRVNLPDNAAWNGHAMLYGSGESGFVGSLAKALDVAGHEMTHGVIQNTANLVYRNQPGALNESFSDVFGAMIEGNNWQLGEEVVNPSFFPTGAMRDMQNPNNGGGQGYQPASMSQYENVTKDNGGVHINSGIPNRAFYLFATSVGKSKAEQVYYRALTRYLTQSSQFVDCRLAVEKAAADLYDNSVVNAARAAFDGVGIIGSSGGDYEVELPEIVGGEHMLIHDLYPDEFNLSDVDFGEGNISGLSTRAIKRKPSVVEDGSAAVFVSDDSHVYAIRLDVNNPEVTQLSELPEWDNAAASKDGNKVAFVSIYSDRTIHVFDLQNGGNKQFELYNPSTSNDGAIGGVPQYADFIEWDLTGQYIMYDAFNQINSNTGEEISYWDVGVVQVWDNEANTFANGTITKIFTSLPPNVSVGNATFSKNSPHIISFDYLNSATNEYSIRAGNIETGVSNIIYEQSLLGFPTYSMDDQTLAFSGRTNEGKKVIATIKLGADKISGSGSPQILVEDGEWPSWYAKGSRDFKRPNADFEANITSNTGRTTVNFFDKSTNSPTEWEWSFGPALPSTSKKQNPIAIFKNMGSYTVTLKASNPGGSDTETKQAYINIHATDTNNPALGTNSIIVYPNPSQGTFNVQLQTNQPDTYQLEVYDIAGKRHLQTALNVLANQTQHEQLTLADAPDGLYLLKIFNEKTVQQYKILINR